METLNLLNCELCGYQSKNLVVHVRKKHGMSSKDYKDKFPEAKLVYVSEAQKVLAREKTKKWLENESNKEFLKQKRKSIWQKSFWMEKGLTEEQAIKKVSSLQKRTFSEETKRLYSAQRRGKANCMSLENIAKRNACSLEEAKILTPCFGRKKEKHPMYGKNHTDEAKKKICANTPNTFFNKSSGEKELQTFIEALYNEVQFNKGIGPYNCDVVLEAKKIVIEYFGDYWHCNPDRFAAQDYNKRLHCTANIRWQKDELKKTYFENMGFTYVVVWEQDWKTNKETVKEKIKCILNM